VRFKVFAVWLGVVACETPIPVAVEKPVEAVVLAPLITSCEDFHDIEGQDGALVPVLCPDLELNRANARAALLATSDVHMARRQKEPLSPFPELGALAALAGQIRGPLPLPETVEGTERATPLDDEVLARTARAHQITRDEAQAMDARTSAHAFLFRVYSAACETLGTAPGQPSPPLWNLLVAESLHQGRVFARNYTRDRVAGLATLAAEVPAVLRKDLARLDPVSSAAAHPRLEYERARATRSFPPDPVSAAAAPPVFTAPEVIAREIEHLVASAGSGFPRRHALARATLLLRTRPDAISSLGAPLDPTLRSMVRAEALASERRESLRVVLEWEAVSDDRDLRVRAAFALAAS
jgi:hypothetical protein